MPKQSKKDQQQDLLEKLKDGQELTKASAEVGLEKSTAQRAVQAEAAKDTPEVKQELRAGKHHMHYDKEGVVDTAIEYISEHPTVTLRDLRTYLVEALGVHRVPAESQLARYMHLRLFSIKHARPTAAQLNAQAVKDDRKKFAEWWQSCSREERNSFVFIGEHSVSLWTSGWSRYVAESTGEAASVEASALVRVRGPMVSMLCAISPIFGCFFLESKESAVNSTYFEQFGQRALEKWTQLVLTVPDRPRTKASATLIFDEQLRQQFPDAPTAIAHDTDHSVAFVPLYSHFLNPVEDIMTTHKEAIEEELGRRIAEFEALESARRSEKCKRDQELLEEIALHAWHQIPLKSVQEAIETTVGNFQAALEGADIVVG